MKVRNQPTLRKMKIYYYWTNIRKWNYLLPPSLKISEVVPMGAIVIRTRYDEGTESAEVAKSGFACHSDADIEAILNHLLFFC